MIIPVFDRVENIVEKGENVGNSIFSFSYNVLKKLLSKTCQKVSLCGNGLTRFILDYLEHQRDSWSNQAHALEESYSLLEKCDREERNSSIQAF